MVKKLNIAIIVLGSIALVAGFVFAFGVSVFKQSIDINGGFEALAKLTNTTSNSASTGYQNAQININDSNSLSATSFSDGDLSAVYNAAYSFIVAYVVIFCILTIAIIVFASLIVVYSKDRHKLAFCRNINIWSIVASVLTFNLVVLILSIISLVLIVKNNKSSQ